MQTEYAELREQFHKTFGGSAGDAGVRVIRAPGRVNLIGEHTDYNDGFVCPMAIEPEVRIICRARDDGVVRLASTAFRRANRRIFRPQQDRARAAQVGEL